MNDSTLREDLVRDIEVYRKTYADAIARALGWQDVAKAADLLLQDAAAALDRWDALHGQPEEKQNG